MERAAGDSQDRQERAPRNAALQALRWNWGSAYEIEANDGEYRARRRDGLGGWITATTPEELRSQILADYLVKPVPPSRRVTP